jgi:hypothetical protein
MQYAFAEHIEMNDKNRIVVHFWSGQSTPTSSARAFAIDPTRRRRSYKCCTKSATREPHTW